MLPMTAEFFKAIRASHTVAVRVDALRNGAVVLEDVPVGMGGSVIADSNSQTRRRLNLTIPDLNVWDTLKTPGTELRVQRGVRYGDSRIELAAAGVFPVGQPSRAHGSKSISVSAPDRWAVVSRARFTAPRQWDRSWGSVADAIQALMLGPWTERKAINPAVRVPGFTNLMPGAGAPQRAAVWVRDRSRTITDLAASIGGEAYFDTNGDGVLRPMPVLGAHVWEADASPTGVLVSATEILGYEDAYNTVIVYGVDEAGQTTVTGMAQITDPSHPLWVGGEFGVVPYFYSSPTITRTAQAVATARALLETAAAVGGNMPAACLPNPALEPGDTIRVRPDRNPVDHILSGFQLPLTADAGIQDLTLLSARPALPGEAA